MSERRGGRRGEGKKRNKEGRSQRIELRGFSRHFLLKKAVNIGRAF